MPKNTLSWKKKPEAADFAAAFNYLSLVYPDAQARTLVSGLRKAGTTGRAAKDLLRATGLPLLPRDEAHVETDLRRIHKGKPLSPVLLVQGDLSRHVLLVIADGYHRICAVCYFDEDAPIACRMTPAPAPPR